MIVIEASFDGFQRATAQLAASLDQRVQQGFELTLESIAARAKQTPKFVDRTGALRSSIQSDGVSGSDPMVGVVSFAASNERGDFYGAFLELGTKHITPRLFITDAIEAEDGSLIESAMARAFRDCGFDVRGG